MSQDFLTVSYSQAKKFLLVNWNRPVNSEEFRNGIRVVAVCVAKLQAEFILVDLSLVGTASIEDQRCTATFLKQALRNSSLRRSARVLSTSESQWHAYQRVMEEACNLPYQTSVFHSRGAAREWLFEEQESMGQAPDDFIPVILKNNVPELYKASPAAGHEGKEGTRKDTQYRTDFVEITSDVQNSLLLVRWLRPVQSREYRYGILKVGRILLARNLEGMLINNQRLNILTFDDQNWLVKTSIELISRSRLQRLAVVSSNDMLQQMTDEALDCKVKEADLTFQTRYFLSEEEALDWLMLPEEAIELRR